MPFRDPERGQTFPTYDDLQEQKIATFTAERDAIRTAYAELLQKHNARAEIAESALTAIKARVEGLLKACEPFAAYADRIAKERPGWDHDGFSFRLPDDGPGMKEFRRLRDEARKP